MKRILSAIILFSLALVCFESSAYNGEVIKFKMSNSKIYPLYVGEEYDLPMHIYPKTNMHLEGFCVDNNDGKTILVVINPNDTKRQMQINLDGTWWYAELTPESISTIIIEK